MGTTIGLVTGVLAYLKWDYDRVRRNKRSDLSVYGGDLYIG
ncbi:MAG: hypothetical protein AAFS10_03730 [Myxococcota bacterium]